MPPADTTEPRFALACHSVQELCPHCSISFDVALYVFVPDVSFIDCIEKKTIDLFRGVVAILRSNVVILIFLFVFTWTRWGVELDLSFILDVGEPCRSKTVKPLVTSALLK